MASPKLPFSASGTFRAVHPDYHQVLGVERTASTTDIVNAFQIRIRLYHLDDLGIIEPEDFLRQALLIEKAYKLIFVQAAIKERLASRLAPKVNRFGFSVSEYDPKLHGKSPPPKPSAVKTAKPSLRWEPTAPAKSSNPVPAAHAPKTYPHSSSIAQHDDELEAMVAAYETTEPASPGGMSPASDISPSGPAPVAAGAGDKPRKKTKRGGKKHREKLEKQLRVAQEKLEAQASVAGDNPKSAADEVEPGEIVLPMSTEEMGTDAVRVPPKEVVARVEMPKTTNKQFAPQYTPDAIGELPAAIKAQNIKEKELKLRVKLNEMKRQIREKELSNTETKRQTAEVSMSGVVSGGAKGHSKRKADDDAQSPEGKVQKTKSNQHAGAHSRAAESDERKALAVKDTRNQKLSRHSTTDHRKPNEREDYSYTQRHASTSYSSSRRDTENFWDGERREWEGTRSQGRREWEEEEEYRPSQRRRGDYHQWNRGGHSNQWRRDDHGY